MLSSPLHTPNHQQQSQRRALCIHNFVPQQHQQQQLPADGERPAIGLLPIWVGDQVHLLASQGQWCFGHLSDHPERRGLFPRSNVIDLSHWDAERSENAETESRRLTREISGALRNWWAELKSGYRSGKCADEQCELHIRLIRELLMTQRRLRSGTVPAGELSQLRLNVVRTIDAGNYTLGLEMNIRDQLGKPVRAEELSVVEAYRRHEQMQEKLVAKNTEILQQSNLVVEERQSLVPLTNGGPPSCSFSSSPSSFSSAHCFCALLLTVEHAELARVCGDNSELVLGLGRTILRAQGPGQTLKKTTQPLTEPLSIFLSQDGKTKSSKLLFVGLTGEDLRGDKNNSLSLWMTALRIGQLGGQQQQQQQGTGKGRGDEVRQFFAYGQMDLGELMQDMADQEQREMVLKLCKRHTTPSNPSSPNAENPLLAQQQQKVAVPVTVQMFIGKEEQILAENNTELRDIVCLRKMKEDLSTTLLPMPMQAQGGEQQQPKRRNQLFIWLRDADFHGIGRSDKNIEASISVVDDEGAFQPEAIEIVTPNGANRMSSFRCRVWPSEDRPRINELVKVRLPEGEVRGLHLQILFYNKSSGEKREKAVGSSSAAANRGPFALAFLRILDNFVLCADDEDEMFIYRVDKAKGGTAGADNESTRPWSVSYLSQWAKRKEMRSSTGRSASIISGTLVNGRGGTFELAQQMNGTCTCPPGAMAPAAGYTWAGERNGVHFHCWVCSQLHCTSPTLVQVLRWQENEQQLRRCLNVLCSAEMADLAHELAKFLPNLLDSLFQIADAIPQLHQPVFDTLVHICRFCEDSSRGSSAEQKRFRPMLEQYVRHIHFPNAHNFLLLNLIRCLNDENLPSSVDLSPQPSSPSTTFHFAAASRDQLLPVLKSLGFLSRLTLASKSCSDLLIFHLSTAANDSSHSADPNKLFLQRMDQLRLSLLQLVQNGLTRRMACQNLALKHLPELIIPLLEYNVYEPLALAQYVLDLLDSLSEGILLRQRLYFLSAIVSSELFSSLESRKLLLERFLDELLSQMPPHLLHNQQKEAHKLARKESVADSIGPSGKLEAVQSSAKILANLLDRLFPYSRHKLVLQSGTPVELSLILHKSLRPLNQTMITLLGDPSHQRTLHALLLAILDKFSAKHFADYFTSLPLPLDKIDALSEMLHMFRDLVQKCPAPRQWTQMHRIQSKLILKQIRFASGFIKCYFGPGEHFEPQLWTECMFSCMAMAKCSEGDDGDGGQMRLFAAEMLRSLWYSLALDSKMQLIPLVVGPMLEVALSSDGQLRELLVPLFFDMFASEQCGGSVSLPDSQCSSAGVVLRKTVIQQQRRKGKFEEEFVRELDKELDASELEDRVVDGFASTFRRMAKAMAMRQEGSAEAHNLAEFVQRIDRLLELFAAYRSVRNGDGMLEAGMFCTVQLIDFYQSIGQNDLYVIYIYKLHALHITAGDWVEAGLTLQRHANLLKWSTERIPDWLYGSPKENSRFGNQLELKEHLYREMAELFAKGEHWEWAIEANEELAGVYKSILFDYTKLSALYRKTAELYENVAKKIRLESNYFLVSFYGRDCPLYLANKKFIFRGVPLEQYIAFKERILASFLGFKSVDSMDDCEQTMREEPGKYLQIIAVTPVPSPAYISLCQSPCRLASWYYKHHRVQKFEFVKREFRSETKWNQLEDSESMRLWLRKRLLQTQRQLPDLVTFSPVVSQTDQEPMNPVEVAVEKVKEANDKLADMAGKVSEGFAQFVMNLGGMIRGVVQADVGGGVRNYQSFFSAECRAHCSEEENRSIEILKLLMLEQVTLLEFALFVHAQTEQAKSNATFHNSLASSFLMHRGRVEGLLGTAKSILPDEASIYVAEQATIGESRSNAQLNTLVAGGIGASPSRVGRSQSLSESQNKQLLSASTSAGNGGGSQLRPPSATSSNSSCSSYTTTASAIFRNSPLGAASSLIRTTIQQGKSKQKHKYKKMESFSSRRRNKTIAADSNPPPPLTPTSLLSQPLGFGTAQPPGLGYLAAAISQFRVSDASMDNFETNLAPPLPARVSDLHSQVPVKDNPGVR